MKEDAWPEETPSKSKHKRSAQLTSQITFEGLDANRNEATGSWTITVPVEPVQEFGGYPWSDEFQRYLADNKVSDATLEKMFKALYKGMMDESVMAYLMEHVVQD